MLVPAIGGRAPSSFNVPGKGSNVPASTLAALPANSLLWGLWPMDTLSGGFVADVAPAKGGFAATPPNVATLSGTTAAATKSRTFAPGAAYFVGASESLGATGAHPLDPAYWMGGHALTYSVNVRLNSGRTDAPVVIASGGGSFDAFFNRYPAYYGLQLNFSTKTLGVFADDETMTSVNYSYAVTIPDAAFDDAFHNLVFVRVAATGAGGFSDARVYLDGALLDTHSVQSTLDSSPVHGWDGTTCRTCFPGWFGNGAPLLEYTLETSDAAVWKAEFAADQVTTVSTLNAQNRRLRSFLGL